MKKTNYLSRQLIMIIVTLIAFQLTAHSQNLPRLNKAFPDFALMDHRGDSINLSDLEGKRVILIFPRGKVSDHWCQLCHYQYAELAKLELEEGICDKHNLEVLFVLPYKMDETIFWTEMFPSQMADIQRWKSIPDDQLSGDSKIFIDAIKEILPQDFQFDEDNPAPLPFSVLADEGHKLSMGIELYSTAWDGFYNEQNAATTFILDEEGIIRFKYFSQETFDRPSAMYLLSFVENMMD